MRTTPTMVEVFPIENDYFFLCSEVQALYPEINKGCRKNSKAFFRKHSIPADKIINARPKVDRDFDGEWVQSLQYSTQKDKAMISVTYFEEHLNPDRVKIIAKGDSEDDQSEPRLPKLPKRIKLTKKECFRDKQGKRLLIKTVGKRKVSKCYFNLGDVEKAFGFKRLADIITNAGSGYRKGRHYLVFDTSTVSYGNEDRDGCSRNASYYLTYFGLARALFASQDQAAEPFVEWAVETLFTAHLGTPEQRLTLASELIGAGPEVMKILRQITSGAITSVYLFRLGTVAALRESMSIGPEYDDADSVYKFGRSIDLMRRNGEHTLKYAPLDGVQLDLIYYGCVDAEYASRAEAEIASGLEDHDLTTFSYDGSRELVIIPDKKIRAVKKMYDAVTKANHGNVKDLIALTTKKEDDHRHEIEILTARSETSLLKAQTEIDLLKVQARLLESEHKAEILEYKLAAALANAR